MDQQTDTETKFEKLVLPELEIMYRTAWLYTRSKSEAEDLVQETLLKAYKALDRFDGRYPRAWLLTIMRNTNINRARKKKPDLLDDPEKTFERSQEFSDTQTPETIVVDPLFSAEVTEAYETLPENFRNVIDLVDLNSFSYKETAAKLGVPVGTVMSRLHRARKQIREVLKEKQVEDTISQGGDHID